MGERGRHLLPRLVQKLESKSVRNYRVFERMVDTCFLLYKPQLVSFEL